ncbi:MAG: endopeptidase La, partial [Cyclobacteriaceae bacterium]|nr:endopeptidase La [Cyclobacteriaceae bacterium]
YTVGSSLAMMMKESAMAALSYLKYKRRSKLGIDYRYFRKLRLTHSCAGRAVPKDGPSAGVTMFTSLASVYTQRKVKAKLAMTGEITLRGKVLPVGGIKEKILAAKRAGIKEIVLCSKNKKDIDEIDKRYLSSLKIHFVDTVDEVISHALLNEKVKNPMIFDLKQSMNMASQN